MNQQLEQTIECPYCGEVIEVLIDPSEANQSYIEDCQVCCQPIQLNIEIEGESAIIFALQDNA